MKKWARIEEYLIINTNISINLLNQLEKAYKNSTTEEEQEEIINKVFKQIFTSNMEVQNNDIKGT